MIRRSLLSTGSLVHSRIVPTQSQCHFTTKRKGNDTNNTTTTNPKKESQDPPPRFKGYIETVRDIMNMPLTTADPNIPTKRVTADYCAQKYTSPPRNVTMLTRDFIHDSLYHPKYGYFSKQALIFSPDKPYKFNRFRDSAEFLNIIGRQYDEIEKELDDVRGIPRQLWHTPTEILKPWYGNSIARHIVKEYKKGDTNIPLVVYEMGGGNGTLMMNVLDYIKDSEPEIYSQMKYNLIEISTKLAKQQLSQQTRHRKIPHRNIRIINKSIFEWQEVVDSSCFFIAMEVIDNFAHDVVRYDFDTTEPYQAIVRVYDDGEYEEFYEPINDPLVADYLKVRGELKDPTYRSPAIPSALYRKTRAALPLAPNLTMPEFVPTQAFEFCRILHKYFPRHHLVLSDFFKLPDTVPKAVDSPVVQTRFQGSMVPCETYLVQPGWFDIFFPTNFELLKRIYDSVRSNSSGNVSRVCTQREFATENAQLEMTRTRSGENPMLEFYENNKFLLS